MKEIVLGFLVQGPAHGYVLRDRVRRELGPAWRFTSSQIYAWLRELEQEGLVRGQVGPGLKGRPRRAYELTPKGRERFFVWLAEGNSERRRGEFLVRLFFVLRSSPQDVDLFVERETAELLVRRRRLMARKPPADAFARAVHQFRRLQVETGLRWLREVKVLLDKERRPEC